MYKAVHIRERKRERESSTFSKISYKSENKMLHIQIVKFLQSNSMAAVITFYISVYIYIYNIICMKNSVRESSDERYNRVKYMQQ